MFTTSNSSDKSTQTVVDSSAIIIPLNATTTTNPDISKLDWAKIKEAWLLQLTADEMPGIFKQLAVPIAARMNHEKRGDAFPGIAELMTLTGASRSTAIRAIKCFEARGHLKVKRTKNKANHYDPIIKPEIARALILGGVNAVLRYLITGQALAPLVSIRHHLVSDQTLPSVQPDTRTTELTTELTTKVSKKERASADASAAIPISHPIIQIEGVAEKGKAGTVTIIAQPSMANSLTVWDAGRVLSAASEPGMLRQACFGWARKYAPLKVKMVQRMFDDGFTPIQVFEAIKYYGADFVNYLWANPKERQRMDGENSIKIAEVFEKVQRCFGTPEEIRQREQEREQEIDERIRRYKEKERNK